MNITGNTVTSIFESIRLQVLAGDLPPDRCCRRYVTWP